MSSLRPIITRDNLINRKTAKHLFSMRGVERAVGIVEKKREPRNFFSGKILKNAQHQKTQFLGSKRKREKIKGLKRKLHPKYSEKFSGKFGKMLVIVGKQMDNNKSTK